MNKITPFDPRASYNEPLQDRFGARVAAALSARLAAVPAPDIDARLRFAREQAVAHAMQVRRQTGIAGSVSASGGGTAVLGGPESPRETPWWLRLSSLVPLAVLLAGLLWIDHRYTQQQIEAAAEVDAAILADDLPPDAYRDPGFVEFLKSSRP